jgi:uncharacterized protein (TIGR00725 family)
VYGAGMFSPAHTSVLCTLPCNFPSEKDCDSLSTAAARGAKRHSGLTIGVTYGKGKDIWDKDGNTDVVIVTGLERGGGREFVLINSCDAVIAIAGGSGTLTELAIAYQSDIPMVGITGCGGWSEKLAGEFMDGRNRRRILPAATAKEAVELALREVAAKK